jgi:hypothetical protein
MTTIGTRWRQTFRRNSGVTKYGLLHVFHFSQAAGVESTTLFVTPIATKTCQAEFVPNLEPYRESTTDSAY